VDAVGVLPTHRRRGVLTALMRAQLDDCHARGETLAALWASETTIYGRFGYGLATLGGQIELPREHTSYATPFSPFGATRLVPLTEAEKLVAPVWEAVAARTPGMFARSSAWWQMRPLMDFPWQRGSGELRCVVLEVDGEPAAYALYRMNQSWIVRVSPRAASTSARQLACRPPRPVPSGGTCSTWTGSRTCTRGFCRWTTRSS
jgi:predicted acetyltransferase